MAEALNMTKQYEIRGSDVLDEMTFGFRVDLFDGWTRYNLSINCRAR